MRPIYSDMDEQASKVIMFLHYGSVQKKSSSAEIKASRRSVLGKHAQKT